MFTVYCIKAEDGRFYTGVTANRYQRLHAHNSGKCATTRGNQWRYYYWIELGDKCDAMLCERWLKAGDTKRKRAQVKLAFDQMTPDFLSEALLVAARRWQAERTAFNLRGGV